MARSPASVRITPSSLPTVLLSVAGLTPQVITETLYCLVRKSKQPVPVREIRVVTTQPGAERVRQVLLSPRHGWFHRFCRDFGIPAGAIRFDASCVLVPKKPNGRGLEDVRTPTDNALVADTITSLVRDLTQDPSVSLHCSVAGGRKTMGMFLGIAFQLFSRPIDQLSHVLVWPPGIESHREFFYPPPRPTTYSLNGRTIHSRHIKVDLAEIPIVQLRSALHFPGWPSKSYATLVRTAEGMLGTLRPRPLGCHVPSSTVHVGSESFPLPPQLFAFYTLFASHKLHGCTRPDLADCGECCECYFSAGKDFPEEQLERIIHFYRVAGGRDPERLLASLRGAGAADQLRQLRSKTNQVIASALGGELGAAPYLIRGVGRYRKRHGLPLDKNLIRVEE